MASITRATRRTGAAKQWLLAAATFALGFAVLELGFGLWLRANPWNRALALNIVLDRQVTYDASGLYDGGGPLIYTRDRYGLRGTHQHPSDITILTVGGSATDQRYVADGFTWQDELQRILRSEGHHVTVANAGVDGHSTFGHLASYRYWFPLVPDLHPAYTVLYLGVNDLFVDAPVGEFEGTADGETTLVSRIKGDSALYRLYSLLRGTLLAWRVQAVHRAVDFHTVPYTRTPRLSHHDAIASDRIGRFEQRFRTLLQRVREQG